MSVVHEKRASDKLKARQKRTTPLFPLLVWDLLQNSWNLHQWGQPHSTFIIQQVIISSQSRGHYLLQPPTQGVIEDESLDPTHSHRSGENMNPSPSQKKPSFSLKSSIAFISSSSDPEKTDGHQNQNSEPHERQRTDEDPSPDPGPELVLHSHRQIQPGCKT